MSMIGYLNLLVAEIHPTGEYIYEEKEGDTDDTFDERFRWTSTDLAKPTLAELMAVKDQALLKKSWSDLRLQRDRLLSETDWMASSDRTITTEEREYRQALRDLPANTSDPANPTWPTKP